jgi:gas vesicle protein
MRQDTGGGSFVMGLQTGTVLGAGLGILFAPKAGSELRSKLSDQAGNIANTASEGYRRASESAGQWAEKGRDMYNKASEAVAKGADEAQQYGREKFGSSGSSGTGSSSQSTGSGYGAGSGSPSSGSGYGAGSTYGSSSENIRGAGERSTSEPDRSTGGSGSSGRS